MIYIIGSNVKSHYCVFKRATFIILNTIFFNAKLHSKALFPFFSFFFLMFALVAKKSRKKMTERKKEKYEIKRMFQPNQLD